MNRQREFFLIAFVVLFVLFLLTACTNTETTAMTTPNVTTAPTTSPVTSEPKDPALFDGVLLYAVHGTGDNGQEAVMSQGFVQLYNENSYSVPLDGASLYYKSEHHSFIEFQFPPTAAIPAKGYYLVRTREVEGFKAENTILALDNADADWDLLFDNKEVTLLLAPSHRSFDKDASPDTLEGVNSIFVATDSPSGFHYEVNDLSRNKIAIRTAKTAYSGFHLVNLTRRATSELVAICPQTAKGEKNRVVASRLDEVTFSHAAGFYENNLSLTLTASDHYAVYYTLDGSDPSDAANRARRLYTAPIKLTSTEAIAWGTVTRKWNAYHGSAMPTEKLLPAAHVIKAFATDGKNKTPVFTNTYFIASEIDDYHIPVMSFTLPLDDVIGKTGFYSNFCPTGDANDPRPRGTGMMEVFDENGTRVGYSVIEAAVSGNGGSAYYAMKPLRLYYKGSLNENNGGFSQLNYDLFEGLAKDANGNPITSFDRLLLRNSGNDCGSTYIRDAYLQRVSAGLSVDTLALRTVFLFINGEFWGVYNARERYSSEYVASHYGVAKENVAIIENDYRQVHTNPLAPYVATTNDPTDADDFNDLVDYIRQNDMSHHKLYEVVKNRMDIDSFIDMWVVRLYFNATDWPNNNVKVFRNKNPNDPSGMDTKWRFALHDLDLGILNMDHLTYTQNIFYAFDDSSVCGAMMCDLMENISFKRQFFVRYYTLVTEYFTPDYLLAEFEILFKERLPLMTLQAARWGREGADPNRFISECDYMREFIQNRNAYALDMLYRHFDITEREIKELIYQQGHW